MDIDNKGEVKIWNEDEKENDEV